MLSLPYHVFVLAGGLLAATYTLESGPSLTSLDVSPLWAIPLLWLGRVTSLLAERHPEKRLVGIFHLAVPLLVFGAFLYGTKWPVWALGLTDFRAIHEGTFGFEVLPLFAPLFVAHLAVCSSPRRWNLAPMGSLFSASWRVRIPLALWAMFLLFLGVGELTVLSDELQAVFLVSPAWQLLQLVLALSVAGFFASRILVGSLDLVPLEGHLRRRAEALALSAGIRGIQFHEWRTDHEIANAMVVAQPPFGWRVLFTDGLLDSLGADELEAVLAHELGHIRGRHVRSFIVWILAVAIGFMAIESLGFWGAGWVSIGASLGLLFGLMAWIGFLSRRFELEADFFAAQWKTEGLSSALLELTASSGRHHKNGYRHFSTSRRILFLRGLQRDSGVGDRLQASVRLLRRVGAVSLALSLALIVWAESEGGLRRDLIEAVQLGQYPRAAALLEGADPEFFGASISGRTDISKLVAFGASVAGERESLSGKQLAEGALARIERNPTEGSLLEVVAILDLAIMRHFGNAPGERDLRISLIMQKTGFGSIEQVERAAALPELPQAWREVAQAAVAVLRAD